MHHGFLCADAFQHRVRAGSFGQFLDARNAFIPSLCHNVRSAKFACELLAGDHR
jgi:hypothetical protein